MIQDIEKYIEFEAWQFESIKQGIEDIENNNTVSIEDIKTEWKLLLQ